MSGASAELHPSNISSEPVDAIVVVAGAGTADPLTPDFSLRVG